MSATVELAARTLAFALLLCLMDNVVGQEPSRTPSQPDEFFHDFRGSRPLPPGWRLDGAVTDAVLQPEEGGFRIKVPPDPMRTVPRVGLDSKITLRGDFEITAGFEILQADRPTQGYGVGFELFARTLPQEGLGVYRVARVKEGDVYMVSRNRKKPNGEMEYLQRYVATTAKTGRVRLTRAGTTGTAWAADGNSDTFMKLADYDLGNDDVTGLWLRAFMSPAPDAVDLRVTEMRIKTVGAVPAPGPVLAAETGSSAPPSGAKAWRVLVLVLAIVLLLAGVSALWRYTRRRDGSDITAPP